MDVIFVTTVTIIDPPQARGKTSVIDADQSIRLHGDELLQDRIKRPVCQFQIFLVLGRMIGDAALRQRGMAVGGNYGALAGKVFRIGHMGNQAKLGLVQRGMDILNELIGGG